MSDRIQSQGSMPEHSHSLWLNSVERPTFEQLKENSDTEAIIIGAGISGITTAYLLSQQGIKVTILDAGKIMNGTTGYTTAKLTAQHSLIYDHLLEEKGKEQAKLYYQANMEAIDFVRELVEKQGIDCEFKQDDAYIYAESEEGKKKLDKEYEAYQKLGIESRYMTSVPLDVDIEGTIVMPSQAQFNPVKYLWFLIEEIIKAGGQIFENTRVVDIETGKRPVIKTDSGFQISGDYVAVCSHYPFYDKKGFYFARMYPSRSYLLAAKTKSTYPGGMYINAEKPVESLRSATFNNEQLVLIGGHGHPIGHKADTMENYKQLSNFAEKVFGVEDVLFRWSSQDPATLDNVPYIGKYSKREDNIFVATGYRKWGMSSGTLAGILIRDLVLKKENPYQHVFSPQRSDESRHTKKLIKTNEHNVKMLVKEKMQKPDKTIVDLQTDQGAVVTANGKRAGAYKDGAGTVHLVDTTCTHMGCEVEWNNGERSWDCPCHGSRFDYRGEVIEGPATKSLKKLESEEH